MQSRRDALKRMIYMATGGTLALQALDEIVFLFENDLRRGISPFTGDTFRILMNHHLYRRRIFPSHQAFADVASSIDDTAVIVIKVMNLVHTPLVFHFPEYRAQSRDPGQYKQTWSQKIQSRDVLAHMLGYGVGSEAQVPRFRRLSFNNWFANLLNVGRDETAGLPDWIMDGEIAPFPEEDDVAIQAALHVNQTDTVLNHSFKNTTLLAGPEGKGGDLNYHLAAQGLVNSPLGITCFNMGKTVETTDGLGRVPNRVLGSNLIEVKANGESVADYVELIRRSIGTGFINEELVDRFDKLAAPNVTLRSELQKSRPNLELAMQSLQSAGEIERQVHNMLNMNGASLQAYVPLGGKSLSIQNARWEFLAQCMFVSRALSLPGRPMRNFSLLLNIHDMDGRKLDQTSTSEGDTEALTNIEGMRQLALGLNVLSQAIKRHRNVYVVCVAEGGRGAGGGDNKVSHAILMGPGGRGNLKDYLYANHAAIKDPNDPFCADPNEGSANASDSPGLTMGGAGLRVYSNNDLRTEAGNTLTDTYTNTANILTGLVKHLEEKQGRKSTTVGLGPYLRIAKKV